MNQLHAFDFSNKLLEVFLTSPIVMVPMVMTATVVTYAVMMVVVTYAVMMVVMMTVPVTMSPSTSSRHFFLKSRRCL